LTHIAFVYISTGTQEHVQMAHLYTHTVINELAGVVSPHLADGIIAGVAYERR
jgi:hypothetical protein